MKSKILFIIEMLMVAFFLAMFLLKHFGLMTERWFVVALPILILGTFRMCIVFLVGVFNISNMFKWLKYKITGKQPLKVKLSRKQTKNNKR